MKKNIIKKNGKKNSVNENLLNKEHNYMDEELRFGISEDDDLDDGYEGDDDYDDEIEDDYYPDDADFDDEDSGSLRNKVASTGLLKSLRHNIMNNLSDYTFHDFLRAYNEYMDNVSEHLEYHCPNYSRLPDNMENFAYNIIPTVEAVEVIEHLSKSRYTVSMIYRLYESSLYLIAEDDNEYCFIEKEHNTADLSFRHFGKAGSLEDIIDAVAIMETNMPIRLIPYENIELP